MDDFNPLMYFKTPKTPRQRQYEALRAYYLESLSQKDAAERFGYSVYTFQSLVSNFQNGRIDFFPQIKYGPKERRVPESISQKIVMHRKKNQSIYEIKDLLERDGIKTSIQTISRILHEEGFGKLARRSQKELGLSVKKTIIPPVATQLDFKDLPQHSFECQVGGIYYFIPYILKTNLYDHIINSSFPETSKLSKVNSIMSILALKLMGHERLSRINDYNLDTGLGFFSGLNVPPKSSATSTYSYRVDRDAISAFLEGFISDMTSRFDKFYQGKTINLDFHSIPHYGELSNLDENWVGAKHITMKSALTFLAQDGESGMLLYENSDIDRKDAPEEIMNFVDYWLRVKGMIDQTLVFDSKLTTYKELAELDRQNIKFITLRRRGVNIIDDAMNIPDDEWMKVNLKKKKRKHNRFKIHESRVLLKNTDLKVRQLIFKEHGRELPTFLITNNEDLDIETLALHYSNRWLIENKISEVVDFFNLNSLSSPFMIRIYFDVMLTIVADTLYRMLASDLRRFENSTPKTLFSEFINCRCKGIVNGTDVLIRMKKKKTSPIFKSSEVYQRVYNVPWWGGRECRYDWMA